MFLYFQITEYLGPCMSCRCRERGAGHCTTPGVHPRRLTRFVHSHGPSAGNSDLTVGNLGCALIMIKSPLMGAVDVSNHGAMATPKRENSCASAK